MEPRDEIRGEEVRKAFGAHTVLDGVSLAVPPGSIVAIVGGSGSGKTVLLNILTGLLPLDSGRVLVTDHSDPAAPLVDLAALGEDARDRVRLHWAVVFQHNALHSGTVRDNIALWLHEHTDLDDAAIEARVRESLQAVALDVDDVIDKDREELSGGMAKRVAVARALAIDPIDIFYDEPTTGLDPVYAGHVHELIWNVHHRAREDDKPRTTLLVTHDRELLRRLHPRVVMLADARVCFDGPYDDFTRSPLPEAREYLTAMPALHLREAR
ncbi:MAG: ATP-binding cassette domain-containing protein [Phycisphaerae bacterium]|nr:ATP-binding cassette domain-containing protein [Phycisphaerae bacterium]